LSSIRYLELNDWHGLKKLRVAHFPSLEAVNVDSEEKVYVDDHSACTMSGDLLYQSLVQEYRVLYNIDEALQDKNIGNTKIFLKVLIYCGDRYNRDLEHVDTVREPDIIIMVDANIIVPQLCYMDLRHHTVVPHWLQMIAVRALSKGGCYPHQN
jgi:hypothetical protein